jgi:hypothetical protein
VHCALRAVSSQVFTLVAELTSGSEQVVATSVYVVKTHGRSVKSYVSIRRHLTSVYVSESFTSDCRRDGYGGYAKYIRRTVRGRYK